jgi:hypothetical protein
MVGSVHACLRLGLAEFKAEAAHVSLYVIERPSGQKMTATKATRESVCLRLLPSPWRVECDMSMPT